MLVLWIFFWFQNGRQNELSKSSELSGHVVCVPWESKMSGLIPSSVDHWLQYIPFSFLRWSTTVTDWACKVTCPFSFFRKVCSSKSWHYDFRNKQYFRWRNNCYPCLIILGLTNANVTFQYIFRGNLFKRSTSNNALFFVYNRCSYTNKSVSITSHSYLTNLFAFLCLLPICSCQ